MAVDGEEFTFNLLSRHNCGRHVLFLTGNGKRGWSHIFGLESVYLFRCQEQTIAVEELYCVPKIYWSV